MNETKTQILTALFCNFSGLPGPLRVLIILFFVDAIIILVWLLFQGYTFVWNGKQYGIGVPKKMSIQGIVKLKGYPAGDTVVRLDSNKEIETDSLGFFVYANLNPRISHSIEVVTEYGIVKRTIPGEKGPVKLGVIEAATNVALGKPVVYNSFQFEKSDGVTTVKTTLPQYHKIYSLQEGHYPHNLTDGDPKTKFYPAAYFFDVIIDLLGKYKIKDVELVWGEYGLSNYALYVSDWHLYFADKQPKVDSDWIELFSGDKPPEEMATYIKKPFNGRYLRVVAESKTQQNRRPEWIGMFEVKAFGFPDELQAD